MKSKFHNHTQQTHTQQHPSCKTKRSCVSCIVSSCKQLPRMRILPTTGNATTDHVIFCYLRHCTISFTRFSISNFWREVRSARVIRFLKIHFGVNVHQQGGNIFLVLHQNSLFFKRLVSKNATYKSVWNFFAYFVKPTMVMNNFCCKVPGFQPQRPLLENSIAEINQKIHSINVRCVLITFYYYCIVACTKNPTHHYLKIKLMTAVWSNAEHKVYSGLQSMNLPHHVYSSVWPTSHNQVCPVFFVETVMQPH